MFEEKIKLWDWEYHSEIEKNENEIENFRIELYTGDLNLMVMQV